MRTWAVYVIPKVFGKSTNFSSNSAFPLSGAWTIFLAFSLFLRLECLNVDLPCICSWICTNRVCELESRFMSCETFDGVFTKTRRTLALGASLSALLFMVVYANLPRIPYLYVFVSKAAIVLPKYRDPTYGKWILYLPREALWMRNCGICFVHATQTFLRLLVDPMVAIKRRNKGYEGFLGVDPQGW